ncbi:hypothetical protein E4656_08245 [Natronospirillum operosum]|uniref:Uncharacterized protein n=1 Tax=Natronospirillum operosum TaxID=2759953 RepID=A0A4Z0WFC4_9GAMM|nr:hypothetical protein [Natronospirillum operosum]TGG94152.1 hypothetical protein E4656_08245 [Natronospirillum operosum]
MYSPMRNLGANLLFVFSVGGVWAVGYLVSPYLQDQLPPQDIIVLRKSMMMLAVLGFFMATLARAHELQWNFIRDVQSQLGIGAVVTGLVFIIIPAADAAASSVLYGINSLICVAWVAWMNWVTPEEH